jgi:hypothetical protein
LRRDEINSSMFSTLICHVANLSYAITPTSLVLFPRKTYFLSLALCSIYMECVYVLLYI